MVPYLFAFLCRKSCKRRPSEYFIVEVLWSVSESYIGRYYFHAVCTVLFIPSLVHIRLLTCHFFHHVRMKVEKITGSCQYFLLHLCTQVMASFHGIGVFWNHLFSKWLKFFRIKNEMGAEIYALSLRDLNYARSAKM